MCIISKVRNLIFEVQRTRLKILGLCLMMLYTSIRVFPKLDHNYSIIITREYLVFTVQRTRLNILHFCLMMMLYQHDSISKIGSYLFNISLLPGHFSVAHFFVLYRSRNVLLLSVKNIGISIKFPLQ